MIEKFSFEDTEEVISLIREDILVLNAPDYPSGFAQQFADTHYTRDGFRSMIQNGRQVFVRRDERGRIVATGAYLNVNASEYELCGLFVLISERKKGYGTEMIHYLEDALKELGATKIILYSSVSARPFYDKHGYTQVIEPDFGGEYESIVMVKIIA